MEHDPSPIGDLIYRKTNGIRPFSYISIAKTIETSTSSLNHHTKPMEYDPSPIVRRKDRKSEIILIIFTLFIITFYYFIFIIIFTFISIDMMNDYCCRL